ncbi:VPLPA-CTERM sorting domain-containing protein [Desulfosarcina ovata]|uniref:PEP-CTERM protein-sorting domain-containing protein n=1 Tax=Desulfosarcina ovata subsp. ovata TaxID=2752305 RepID=A0A5K8AHL3_9BACT|nr:VPLPA-CTERM sorting domain-containing protein [Desulfosarcina ovata]BBO92175.1 hypothetical protein DSCOOX_53550 [Desulfosarcina ovata subsp. ovata]
MKRIVSLLAVVLVVGVVTTAQADLIAYTSFEEPSTGLQYTDTGDAGTDHALASNSGEMVVNYTSTGGELGFSSYYTNTRGDVGLTDGDYVGVTTYTPTTSTSYTDGTQGFEMQDADGMMTLTLDTVDLTGYTDTSVSLDLFVAETGWESTSSAFDIIQAYLTMNDGTVIDLLNTTGSDIDDLGIEGYWMTLTEDLSGYTSATLSISLDSNAATEAIYVDNIAFEGSPVPVPAAIWLLGSGLLGLIGIRRRNA